jgi:hypothetical protein
MFCFSDINFRIDPICSIILSIIAARDRDSAVVNVQPPGSAGVSPALRPGWPQPQDAGRMPALPGGGERLRAVHVSREIQQNDCNGTVYQRENC